MDQAAQIAKLLLEIKAVTLNVEQPYQYTSGIISPIYCDNRLIISYPEHRKVIIEAFVDIIQQNNLTCDVIAGTATAGIPHAAWIAEKLNLPMVYVRGNAKKHGKQNQIEGKLQAQQRALVIEDLISTGGSSVSAALALREQQAEVTDCLAIFSYELPQAIKQFADANVNLHTLTTFSTLINVAEQEQYISSDEKQRALEWKEDPMNWGKQLNAT